MIIIITIIIMHLAGSPGSYFAYLKYCLEEWSKNRKTRMYTVHGGTKILRLKLNRSERLSKPLLYNTSNYSRILIGS